MLTRFRVFGSGIALAAALAGAGCAMTAAAVNGPRSTEVELFEIESLELIGVEAVPEGQLRAVLDTRAGAIWPWADSQYFDAEVLQTDLRRIPSFYEAQGYPFARIVSHEIEIDEQEREVRIRIAIDEGAPLRLERLTVTGLMPISADDQRELTRDFPLDEGEPLAEADVATTAKLITDALNNRGYAYASVRVLQARTSPHTMNVTFEATPGPLAEFGEIEITGNVTVNEDIIRRELRYRPGDQFDRRLLQQSYRSLYALGLFRFANLDVLDGAARDTPIRTRVTVVEGNHSRIEGSVGYGTEEKGRAELRWRNVNFLGGARTLAARTTWSWLTRGAELDFTQPYFLHPRVSLHANAHYLEEDEASYDLTARGGTVSLVAALDSSTQVRLTLLSNEQDSQVAPAALAEPTLRDELIAIGIDPETGRQGGQLTSIAIGAERNTADDLLNPARGYFLAGSLEHAGGWLPGVFDFFEWDVSGRHYWSLTPRVVLASRLRVATIDPAGTSEELPFAQRYFLGGSTSLRGWGRYEVSPLSPGGLPLGGKSLVDAALEVRGRVMDRLGVVGFVDAGNVWRDEWQFDLNDLRADVGGGVRYHTPVGPIRLDAAWQLTPIPNLFVEGERQSRRWRIHFSIGQAF